MSGISEAKFLNSQKGVLSTKREKNWNEPCEAGLESKVFIVLNGLKYTRQVKIHRSVSLHSHTHVHMIPSSAKISFSSYFSDPDTDDEAITWPREPAQNEAEQKIL